MPASRPAKPAKPATPAKATARVVAGAAAGPAPEGATAAAPQTAPHAARQAAAPGARRRPVLLVLAGVNGAGKSSIGGNVMLRRAGLAWFNPDTFARRLLDSGLPLSPTEANARAWQHGIDLLDQAVAAGHSHAFETTLGGASMTQKIAAAARTHDVLVWFCGLASADLHLARVAARVAAGGHDIPEAKIRERWVQAPLNLIALMPHLAELKLYDNSSEAAPGSPVPDPVLVLHQRAGRVAYPQALPDLQRTPGWAKPIVMAARDFQRRSADQES